MYLITIKGFLHKCKPTVGKWSIMVQIVSTKLKNGSLQIEIFINLPNLQQNIAHVFYSLDKLKPKTKTKNQMEIRQLFYTL